MAILPVVTACVAPVAVPGPDAPIEVVPEGATVATELPTSPALLPDAAIGEGPIVPPAAPAGSVRDRTPGAAYGTSLLARMRNLATPLLPWAFLGWLVGVVGMSLWHLGGWLHLRRISTRGAVAAREALGDVFDRTVHSLQIGRCVRLLESTRVAMPMMVGWLRPVVLLPVSAATGLTPAQLEAVLAHELAHIRRYDYLVRLMQAAVETLLFYHPAVWWVSGRIRQESEHCCDELAVEVCGDRQAYAWALARVAELGCRKPHLAAAAGGGHLLVRIQRLLGLSDRDSGGSARWPAGMLALVILATIGITVAILASCSPDGRGASPLPADLTWGQPRKGVVLGVKPAKPEQPLTGPVRLVYRLRNDGGKARRFYGGPSVEFLGVAWWAGGNITLCGPDGAQLSPSRAVRVQSRGIDVTPGESCEGILDLAQYFDFEQAGTYRCWFSLRVYPVSDLSGNRGFVVRSGEVLLTLVAQPAAPSGEPAWGGTVDGIQCGVRPTKEAFTTGEDVLVDVLYRNVSERPITVCIYSDPYWRWAGYEITDAEDNSVGRCPIVDGTMRRLDISDFVTIAPNQTASFRQIIRRPYLGTQGLKPGQYRLHIGFNEINKMEKLISGYDQFCQQHNLEPWAGVIESGRTALVIVPTPEARWAPRQGLLQCGVGNIEVASGSVTLEAFLRNTGSEGDRKYFDGAQFEVEVDGERYVHHAWTEQNARQFTVYPSQTIGPLPVALADFVAYQDRAGAREAPRPLTRVGKGDHTIRATYVGRNGSPRVSAPEVTFTVPPGATSVDKPSWGEAVEGVPDTRGKTVSGLKVVGGRPMGTSEIEEHHEEALSDRMLTEDVMKDFDQRNAREGGRLVCSILTPPRSLVMLAVLGEKPEQPPRRFTVERQEIDAERQRLAARIIPLIRRDVAPQSWKNANTHIEAKQGRFLVFQTPDIIEQIREYFAKAAERVPEAEQRVRVGVHVLKYDGPLPEGIGEKLQAAPRFTPVPKVASSKEGQLAFASAILDNDELQALLQEARGSNRVHILSLRPITVVNDQVGSSSAGTAERYLKRDFEYVLDAERKAKIVTGTVESGVKLNCRPIISSDGRHVFLGLRMSFSDLVGWDTPSETEGRVRLPRMHACFIETALGIPNGGTALCSGSVSQERSILFLLSAAVVEEEPDRPQDSARRTAGSEEGAWGEVVEGVQIRLRGDIVESRSPHERYAILKGAFLNGQYGAVQEAFKLEDDSGRPLLSGYDFARLKARNAAAMFLRYDQVDRDNLNGWPTAEGAKELRRLAADCTAAFEQAFRLAPSAFERGRLYCLWHEMFCRGHFDADSRLMRSGSPFAQKPEDIDRVKVDEQTREIRQAVLKALEGNEHARELGEKAREKFADVFSAEYGKLATIGVADELFGQILGDLPQYARVTLQPLALDDPDKHRLTLQYYLWRAIAGPVPDDIEKKAVATRVEEVARLIEEKFDGAVTSDHLPGGHPRAADSFRETCTKYRENRFFPVFHRAPLPHLWAGRNRPFVEKTCENLAKAMQRDLERYDMRLTELERDKQEGRSREQLLELLERRAREHLHGGIRRNTLGVQGWALADFGCYEGPGWHQIPERRVTGEGAKATEHGFFPFTVRGSRPIGPYPVRKPLTSAEASQLRESSSR